MSGPPVNRETREIGPAPNLIEGPSAIHRNRVFANSRRAARHGRRRSSISVPPQKIVAVLISIHWDLRRRQAEYPHMMTGGTPAFYLDISTPDLGGKPRPSRTRATEGEIRGGRTRNESEAQRAANLGSRWTRSRGIRTAASMQVEIPIAETVNRCQALES